MPECLHTHDTSTYDASTRWFGIEMALRQHLAEEGRVPPCIRLGGLTALRVVGVLRVAAISTSSPSPAIFFKKDPALAVPSAIPWTGIFLRLPKLNVVDGSYNLKNVKNYRLETTAPSPLSPSSFFFFCDVSLPFASICLLVFQFV